MTSERSTLFHHVPEPLHWLWLALSQRCRHEDDWNFSTWYVPFTVYAFDVPGLALLRRIGYTLKACVCIALRLRKGLYASIDPYTVTVAEWNVTAWSSMDFMGEAYDFSTLVVAHGWRNWNFDSYRDGTA